MNLRYLMSMFFLFLVSGAFAQKVDTAYFNLDWKPSLKSESTYYRIVKTIEEGKRYEVTDYFNSGKIQMTGIFSSMSPEVKNGIFTWYDDHGEKTQERIYELGKIKGKKNFGSGNSASNASLLSAVLEQQPEFPGGIAKLYKYIGRNFVYPKDLLKVRPKGRILVSFVVDKDGSISEVFVQESVSPLLDAEAIRVVEQMPNWKPGLMDGKPVRVMYNLPISMN